MYRIGQTRPVKVFQLVAKDSIEDKVREGRVGRRVPSLTSGYLAQVLEIQARKEQLISQAFAGTRNAASATAKQRKQSRIEDLRELFA